jgi:signal transduction histidine kinase
MGKRNSGNAASRRDLRVLARPIALFLLALVLGELSNFLTLEIFPGSFFRFKMIAYLVIALRLGPLPGLGLAAILFADDRTMLVVYCLEALVVGLAGQRRPKWSVVSVIGVFWPLIGLPLLGLIYALTLRLSQEALVLSLLKVWLNALFVAVLAAIAADSRLVDRILGSKTRALRSVENLMKFGVGGFVLVLTFFTMTIGLGALRSNSESAVAQRVRAGLSWGSTYLMAQGEALSPETALAGLNRTSSAAPLDPEGHYESSSSERPSYSSRPWRDGLFVRESERSPHPIDRWRYSEYYGEARVREIGLRYVVGFGSTFHQLFQLYASGLAIRLLVLYIAYGLLLLSSHAIAGRFAALVDAAGRLPERIEAGEEPLWPSPDIAELASLTHEFQAVSARLRSLFSDLRESRERLEGTVKAKAAELELRTEEVRLLLARVEREREEERSRISRELHDELGQAIGSLGLVLYLLERHLVAPSAAALENMADMRELLAGLADNMKRLVADLRPSLLDRLGLSEALAGLARERAAEPELRIDFDSAVPEGFAPPEGAKIALYRIAQEAISNAIKHSATEWIGVSLRADDKEAVLEVADRGKGFDARGAEPSLPRSFGLIGMRERCRSLGGEFSVSSSPGSGTLVSAIIPLGDEA